MPRAAWARRCGSPALVRTEPKCARVSSASMSCVRARRGGRHDANRPHGGLHFVGHGRCRNVWLGGTLVGTNAFRLYEGELGVRCTFPVTQPARHRDQNPETPASGGPRLVGRAIAEKFRLSAAQGWGAVPNPGRASSWCTRGWERAFACHSPSYRGPITAALLPKRAAMPP